MSSEHLKISNISLLGNETLPREEVRDASRHLLNCRECRELLPKPSRQEFLAAFFGEMEYAEGIAASTGDRKARLIASMDGFRAMFRPAMAVGLLLVIATGIGVLILSLRQTPRNSNLVAVVDEPESESLYPTRTIPERVVSSPEDPRHKSVSNQALKLGKVKRSKRTESLKESNRKAVNPISVDNNGTRGINVPCGEIASIYLGTSAQDDGIRLTWEKVTNASKYSIYISDLDEKLIDEFESDTATTYTSKAEFEGETVYKWRLIVTLKNGHTLIGASSKFTIAGLDRHSQSVNKSRLQKSGPTNIRCVENK